MKIRGVKVFIFTAIAFVFVSLLSFTPNNFLNSESKVCASGYACEKNYGDCESLPRNSNGYKLKSLARSLDEGDIDYVNLNQRLRRELDDKLSLEYADEPTMCIQENYKYVINYLESDTLSPVYQSDVSMRSADVDNVIGLNYLSTFRICHPDSIGSNLENRFGGCCPLGTQLVGVGTPISGGSIAVTAGSANINGSFVACCPSPYNRYVNLNSGGEWVCARQKQEEDGSYYNEDYLDEATSNQYQSYLTGLSLSKSAGNIAAQVRIGSDFKCPSTASCTLVTPNPDGVAKSSDCINPLNSESCIESVDQLNGPGNYSDAWSCTSCYTAGDAIGVVNSPQNSKNNGKVAICSDDPKEPVQYVEGVNGSITDTEACLKSEGGYQSENYNYCKQCRESGGTWSGLGCVDSTPTGLITWIMRIAYGVMGGVALIQFIIAGIYYQTGQEEKVKEARKNIIATITGLAVLTFSILILRVIGINILDILPTGSF